MEDVVIRKYDEVRDREGVESFERKCEVGPSGKTSLLTDSMGDPMCRIRHSPSSVMLVAEVRGREGEIVGVVRGCIRTVTCGRKVPRNGRSGCEESDNKPVPVFTKAAYILGLRVSPSYRRKGIGLKLVTRLELWFRDSGAEYAYMATDRHNEASLGLFTRRLDYIKFRTPTVLVHPVHAHRLRLPSGVRILRLSSSDAESLYRSNLSTVDFFPRDIDAVLSNKLTLGTFLAVPSSSVTDFASFSAAPPQSWAALSVWNAGDVYKLQVKGLPRAKLAVARASRLLDRFLPWLRIPSVPEISRPFGGLFLYGLTGEGPNSAALMRGLCRWAHNLGRQRGAGVVVAEVAFCEPLREGVPHWARMSFDDMWCIKRLSGGEGYSDGEVGDWTKSPPGTSIFVDPREV
ncbi:probable N-acetyltransferase HLS1 [Nymphaea colorata]|nr:probable N-acetyltransferase HLS1 [Nymphaea colorata]